MKDDAWKNMNAQQHAFTTGRTRGNSNPSFGKNKIPARPKGPSQTLKQPGKLNLKSFAIVNEALARMNLGESHKTVESRKLLKTSTKSKSKFRQLDNAPLAAPEEDESPDGTEEQDYEEAEYEQINDGFSEAVNNIASQLFTFPTSQDQQSSIRNKLRQRREKEQQSNFNSTQ